MGAGKSAAGRAAIGFGKALAGLGGVLGLRGLARLGARLIQGGMGLAPWLAEGVFGQQQAALRELLKQFREGNADDALRRALPMGDAAGRGSTVGAGGRLPSNDFRYRLSSLLGGGGALDLWMGDAEVLEALRREYQLAAGRAIERGDHRRAAFIYGKLLGDFRSAVNALMRGGLYRDAAALLLARLDDKAAAAKAHESAGDFDRALMLYRELQDHEHAAELLRKIGEEESAVHEYILAAEDMVRRNPLGGGRFAAGTLLRKKAGRDDLAEGHFRAGWSRANDASWSTCGLALLRLLADAGRGPDILTLAWAAEARFADVAEERVASDFYHEAARVAEFPALAPVRDELRDRARVGLAAKLERVAVGGVRPSAALVSRILATGKTWSPPAVRDAEFALAALLAIPATPSQPQRSRLRFQGTGPITAACSASDSEDIFLGFEGGEVIAFRPSTGEVSLASQYDLPVAALATSADGATLVVLRYPEGGSRGTLSTHARDANGGYHSTVGTMIDDGLVGSWLTPIVRSARGEIFGLWADNSLELLECGSLLGLPARLGGPRFGEPSFGVLIPRPNDSLPTILLFRGTRWWFIDPPYKEVTPIGAPHAPDRVEARPPMRHPLVSWYRPGDGMAEVAILGAVGTIHWSLFHDWPGVEDRAARGSSGTRGGYTAAAIVATGLIAAAAEGRIDWFAGTESDDTRGLALRGSSPCELAQVAAPFPSRRTGELIAISSAGTALRLGDRPITLASAKR